MKKLIFGTALILALAIVGLSAKGFSEGAGEMGGRGHGMKGMHGKGMRGMGMMGPQMPGGDFYQRFSDDLNLTDQQVEKIEQLQTNFESSQLDKKQELERLMLDMKNQMKEDYDRSKIESLYKKAIDLKTDLQLKAMNYKLDLVDVLTDEQREKMKEIMKDKMKKRMGKGKGSRRNKN
jgi:Spy/CpxP family protein refolding chaperone